MSDQFHVECQCASIKVTMTGEPRVRGICHCEDCRNLLNVPYHSVTAWNKDQIRIDEGSETLVSFQHPTKRMKRYYCANCGEVMFNSNAMDWRIVSQLLIRKCYANQLPEALEPQMHFFYGERIVDVDDDLPKRE